jgi:predicted RNase H-like HicB family nuclease
MNVVLETEIEGYPSIMVEDKEEGLFTMTCLGKGGAIIVGKTKEECLENFKEAMGLSVAIAKLMEFERTGTFNYKK